MRKAFITVYYPSESVKENVCKVGEQVDVLYICDNSPQSNEELFRSAAGKIEYVWFGENLGLSKAFNRILQQEEKFQDDDIILFFDQDSSIGEGYIDKLQAEYDKLVNAGYDVGCLGPVYFNTSNSTVEIPRQKTALNDHTWKVASIITSSMLCTYQTLKHIHFWNEHVFLDMADWDLCWRMKAAGKMCCMTDVVTLTHSLGKGEKKVGPIHLRVGSTFREYYQTRECLYLLTRRYTPLKFRVRFLAMLTVRPVLHLCFLDNRTARAKYIAMGVRDFFRKEYGELKE